MRKEGVVWKIFNALVIVMGLLLILGPVWVIFINSMKTMQEAGQDFFALPSRLNFDNYVELFTRSDFWSSLRNSVIVTVSSVALVVIFVPALAYAVARNMEKRYFYPVSGINASYGKTDDTNEDVKSDRTDPAPFNLQFIYRPVFVCKLYPIPADRNRGGCQGRWL